MGWTYQAAKFYKDNGQIDRKKECEDYLNWETDTKKFEVLKSVMKGCVFYAAVKQTDKTNNKSEVWAAVILTSTAMRDYCNFGYKALSEMDCPYYFDCPKSILDLLTPTDNKYANEWRETCWAKINANKSDGQSLAKLKIGDVIEFTYGNETIRVKKMAPAYQFKTSWYLRTDKYNYVPKKRIKNWTLVEAI